MLTGDGRKGSMKRKRQVFSTRQSMEKEDFEIFHYFDAKMDEVPIHNHGFYEIYMLLNGKVTFRVEERMYELDKGDILIIDPMEFHQPFVETAGNGYERFVLWISKELMDRITLEDPEVGGCFGTGNNLVRPSGTESIRVIELMQKLVDEAYSDRYAGKLMTKSLLAGILAEIYRAYRAGLERDKADAEEPTLVSRVISYIGEHYAEDITLSSIAKEHFVSKYYLSHVFGKTVGTGVYRYVIQKRLSSAREMLENGYTPGEACVKSGFHEYTNFYRAFLNEYGLPPIKAPKRKQ